MMYCTTHWAYRNWAGDWYCYCVIANFEIIRSTKVDKTSVGIDLFANNLKCDKSNCLVLSKQYITLIMKTMSPGKCNPSPPWQCVNKQPYDMNQRRYIYYRDGSLS